MEQPYLLIFAAFFVSAFLKGITGLGFSTICLALLASIIDLRLAIPMVIVPSLGSNVLVMVQAGDFRRTLYDFRWLYIAAFPGLIAGLALLGSADAVSAAGLLGLVLVLYAVFALANPGFQLSPTRASRLYIPVGAVTGFINGATGSQVMPVLPFLMSLGLAPERFVQAINISFTGSSMVMLGGLFYLGFVDLNTLAWSSLGLVPVFIGIKLGGALRRKLPDHIFRIGVLVMLIALGGNLVRSAML